MTIEAFKTIWTGNIIVFSDSSFSIPHAKKNKLNLNFLLSVDKRSFFISTIFSLIITFLGIGFSFIYQIIIDNVIELASNTANSNVDHVQIKIELIFLFVLIILIIQFIASSIRSLYISKMSHNVSNKIFKVFIEKILHFNHNFTNNLTIGEIVAREQLIPETQEIFSTTVIALLLDSITLIASATILIILSIKLFLLVVIMMLIYTTILLLFIAPLNKINRKNIKYNSQKLTILNEIILGLEVINSYNLSNIFEKKYLSKTKQLTTNLRKEFILNNLSKNISMFVESFFIFLILFIGSNLVTSNILTLGELMTFSALSSFFSTPVKNVLSSQEFIQKLNINVEKLNDLLNISFRNRDLIYKFNPDAFINIKNISFSYNYETDIIKRLNLNIKKYDKICLFGKSGTGKTTLLKIIAGLIPPDEGVIEINDCIYKNFLKKIGYIPQNSFIFTGTIEDNICLGNSEYSRLDTILKEIRFYDNFKNFKDGTKTVLTDGGNNLSGSQKQLIGLARALYQETEVLLFDEATSHLDYENEKNIFHVLQTRKVTLILITHNKNLLKYFSKVLYFNNFDSIVMETIE